MQPNHKLFDVSAAIILARLYEVHPNSSVLTASKLLPDIEEMKDLGIKIEKERDIKVISSTIDWLWREEFIRSVKLRMPSPDGSQNGGREFALGKDGLVALRAMPPSLDTDQTLGEKLVSEVRQGGVGAVVGLISKVLVGSISGFN